MILTVKCHEFSRACCHAKMQNQTKCNLEKPHNFRRLSLTRMACGKHISHLFTQKNSSFWTERVCISTSTHAVKHNHNKKHHPIWISYWSVFCCEWHYFLPWPQLREQFRSFSKSAFLLFTDGFELIEQELFLQMLFFSGFFFLSILHFCSLPPVPRWMWTSGCLSSF